MISSDIHLLKSKCEKESSHAGYGIFARFYKGYDEYNLPTKAVKCFRSNWTEKTITIYKIQNIW